MCMLDSAIVIGWFFVNSFLKIKLWNPGKLKSIHKPLYSFLCCQKYVEKLNAKYLRVLKESEGFYIFGFTLVDGSQLGFSYLSCLLKLILLFSLAMG